MGGFRSILVYKRYRLRLKIRAMMRLMLVLCVSSLGLSSFAHANGKQPSKSSHRRHRDDTADNAKDEPPKSEQAQLADKIANCKDDPICGM